MRGQEPGRPCSRGQILIRRRRCGLSKRRAQAAPCQELPACQAAEEPHGPTSLWASFPGRAVAGNPRAANSLPWLNPPCNGERQPPPCLSLPSAKLLSSRMSPLGRRCGRLAHRAVGAGGGLSSQPAPPAGTYPALSLQLSTRMLSENRHAPSPRAARWGHLHRRGSKSKPWGRLRNF